MGSLFKMQPQTTQVPWDDLTEDTPPLLRFGRILCGCASCALQCQDSRVIIQPSTVVVTLPGPILTSHPQSTAIGSSSSAAVGNELGAQGVAINSGSFGCGYGFGGLGCFGGRRGSYIC